MPATLHNLAAAAATIDHQTIAALQRMLDLARAGEILGVAYIILGRRRQWTAGMTGLAESSPYVVMGAHSLIDEVKAASRSARETP